MVESASAHRSRAFHGRPCWRPSGSALSCRCDERRCGREVSEGAVPGLTLTQALALQVWPKEASSEEGSALGTSQWALHMLIGALVTAIVALVARKLGDDSGRLLGDAGQQLLDGIGHRFGAANA